MGKHFNFTNQQSDADSKSSIPEAWRSSVIGMEGESPDVQALSLQNPAAGVQTAPATTEAKDDPTVVLDADYRFDDENEGNNTSLYRFEDAVKNTDVYKKFMYNKEEVLLEAKKISSATGIPVNAIINTPETLTKAREIYDYRKKITEIDPGGVESVDMDRLYAAYPELKSLAEKDENSAAVALSHMVNVKQVHDVIGAFKSQWDLSMMNNEAGLIGWRGMLDQQNGDDVKRYKELQKKMQTAKELPDFLSDPLTSIAGGTGNALGLMGRNFLAAQKRGFQMGAAGAMLGFSVGSAALGVGAVPGAVGGAVKGYSAGITFGMMEDMAKIVIGNDYMEFKSYKDKYGNPVLTDDEAKAYAVIAGGLETGIEFWHMPEFLKVMGAGTAAKEVTKIVTKYKEKESIKSALVVFLKNRIRDIRNSTLGEMKEEGLQQFSNDTISNIMAAEHPNSNVPSYSFGDMLSRAGGSSWNALGGSLGLAATGAAMSNIGAVRTGANVTYNVMKHGHDSVTGMLNEINGRQMINELRTSLKDNEWFKKDPEAVKEVIRSGLEGSGKEDVYIDTALVSELDGGVEILKQIGLEAGMTEEEVQAKIDNKEDITIPTEIFCQTAISDEQNNVLQSYITFDPASACVARIKEYATRIKREMDNMLKLEDKQYLEAVENAVSNAFNNPEQQAIASYILAAYPEDPGAGIELEIKKLKAEREEMLRPYMEEIERGSGNGVQIYANDEGKYMRASNNDLWYTNWYADHERSMTKADKEELAYKALVGEDSYGLGRMAQEEDADWYAEQKARYNSILADINTLSGIKDKVVEIKKSGNIEDIKGLSKEGYSVFKKFSEAAFKYAPNTAVKRAAVFNAILIARFAERKAEQMRKIPGYEKTTAMDAVVNLYAEYGGTYDQRFGGLKQEAVTDIFYIGDKEEFEKQKEAVRIEAEKNGTLHKAPNGKESNLSLDLWLAVRTPAFIEEYGNWEYEAQKEIYKNSTPVDVQPGVIKKVEGESVSKTVTKLFLSKYPEKQIVPTIIGNVQVGEGSVRDSLAHRYSQAKLDATLTLVDGLKQASYLGMLKDHDGNQINNHYFVYKAKYGNDDKIVFLRVRDAYGVKKVYIHEIASEQDVKKWSNSISWPPGDNQVQLRGIALYASIINNFLNGVNKISIELDENGEPILSEENKKINSQTRASESNETGQLKGADLTKHSIAQFPYNGNNVSQEALQQTSDTINPGTLELNAVSARDKAARDYQTKVWKEAGLTDKEIADLHAHLDNIVNAVMEEVKGFAVMEAWQLRDINDPNLLYRVFNEKYKATFGHYPTRSAFKKNGEYELNIDLGSLCTKRESMDALIQILTKRGYTQNLGPTQMEALKSLLKSKGFLTACDICFVETKRVRALNDANKWSFEWKSVLLAADINDDVQIGTNRELSAEQIKRLQEMAGDNFEEAYLKYMPEERKRVKAANGKADLDTGITSSKMRKIAQLMLEDTSLAGEFKPELLLSTVGTDWLFRNYTHTNLANTLASMFGAATAKPLEGFNIYDALSWQRDFDSKSINPEHIYDIGGFRAQSFTDFNPILFVDYVQMFIDLEARRLPIHIYTKVPSLIELFGMSGGMFNMSLVPEIVDSVDDRHAGLKQDENGNWVYAWANESFPVEKAMELRKRDEYGGRVGTIAVGVSDAHIRMMLDDENIDMIIPYHASGMPASVKTKTGLKKAKDYTNYQNTKGLKTGEKEFSYNRALRELGDPRKAAAAYLKWCDDNHYTAKFKDFADHPNYYKLLEDFRGYDNNGKPVIQGAVRLKLPDNFGEILKGALAERSEQDVKRANMENDESLMKEAEKILEPQRLDGEIRDLFVKRLGTALGKKNVVLKKNSEFLDMLEAAYAENIGAEAAKAKVEVFRMENGIVYGYAKNGQIILNENYMNANTPAHEFSHVWAKVAQVKNPKLWAEGVKLLKQSEVWQEVMDDELYDDIKGDENAVASEVLARIVGKENEEYVRRLTDPTHKMAKGKGLQAKIMEWVHKVFEEVRGLFDNINGRELTYEEFIHMPLKTLWDAKRAQQFRSNAKSVLDAKPMTQADMLAERQRLLGQGMNNSPELMTAYHGSPYRFDKFNLQAIGTGEGGAVHGWGLYFALDKETAEKYRDNLSEINKNPVSYNIGGTLFELKYDDDSATVNGEKTSDDDVVKALYDLRGELSKDDVSSADVNIKDRLAVAERAIESWQERLEKNPGKIGIQAQLESWQSVAAGYQKLLAYGDVANVSRDQLNPTLYKVDVPEPEVMLDEDVEFDDQTKIVQDAVTDILGDEALDMNGRKTYYAIAKKLGSAKAASLALKERGVQGIIYYGRKDGDCVVVFDDEAVKVLNRSEEILRQNNGNTHGTYRNINPGKKIINIFQSADESTMAHELGHYFLQEMKELAEMEGAPAQVKRDWETVKKWLNWQEGQVKLTEAQQEQWARAWERYLREGKAPATSLQRAFASFKRWLTNIYRDATMLGVEASPDVKRVMDRLVATQEEIDYAMERADYESFERAGGMDYMPSGTQELYKSLIDRAREEAHIKVLKVAMKDVTEDYEDKKKKYLEDKEAEVREKLQQQPVFFVQEYLDNNPGLGLGDVLGALGITDEEYKENLDRWKTTNIESAVAGFVRKYDEEYKKPSQEQIRQAAEEAVATGEYQKLVTAMELQELEKINKAQKRLDKMVRDKTGEATKEEAQKALKSLDEREKSRAGLRAYRDAANGLYKQIKEYVNNKLEGMTIKDANDYRKWQRLSKQAQDRAAALMVKGDWENAAKAKRQQLVYDEFASRAIKNNREVQKLVDSLTKKIPTIEKNKNLNSVDRYLFNHMLFVFGLAKKDAPVPPNYTSFTDAMMSRDETLENPYVDEQGRLNLPDWLVAAVAGDTVYKGGYHNLSNSTFKDVAAIMKVVYKLGLETNKLRYATDIHGNKLTLEEALDVIANEAAQETPYIMEEDITGFGNMSAKDRMYDIMNKCHVALEKAETTIRKLGPAAYRFIYEPLKEAAINELKDCGRLSKQIDDIFSVYSEKEMYDIKNKAIAKLGTSNLTRENLIMLALNCGTEINLKRVMDGHNVSRADIMTALKHLDGRDWQLVAKVWDLYEERWPELVRVEAEATGAVLQKQEAVPFTVMGTDGTVYNMQGGYFPLKYDPLKSVIVNERAADAVTMAGTAAAAMSVGKSMTKERVQGEVRLPLRRDFGVISESLTEQAHLIAMRLAIKDARRIILNKQFAEIVQQHLGLNAYGTLRKWSADCWAQDTVSKSFYENATQFFRTNQTMAVLGFRTMTALLNVLNVFPMADYLSPARAIAAIKNYYAHPLEQRTLIFSKSAFMAERAETIDKDIAAAVRDKGTWKNKIPGYVLLQKQAFKFIAETDLMLANPLWLSEYQRVYQEGMEAKRKAEDVERDAVNAGDAAVRRVFGSGLKIDQSEVQRNSGIMKLFTMYYSYFSTVYNALDWAVQKGKKAKYQGKDTMKSIAPIASSLLCWVLLPAIGEALIRPVADDDDDKWEAENVSKRILSGIVSNLTGGIPLLRDIVPYALNKAMGERTYGLGSIPAYTAALQLIKLAETVVSDKKDGIDVAREAMRTFDMATGFSMTATDAITTLLRYADNDFDNDVSDFLRAIIFDKKLK